MTARRLVSIALLALLPSLAVAKDELIPTKKKRGPADSQGKQANPLVDLAEDMDAVARLLRVEKTGDATQDRQKAIIDKLDELIEQARKQSQQPPKGGQDEQKKEQQPQQKQQPKQTPQQEKQQEEQRKKQQAAQQKKQEPNRPGVGRGGTGEGSGALHTDAEEWGNLPPAIRDQLLNIQGEGFPLKYRELLRRYYRELAKPKE